MAWYTRDKRISEFAVKKTVKLFQMNGIGCRTVDAKGYDIVLDDGRKIEVKFDTWIGSTGNISAEWWVDEEKRTPGWAQYSDADILVYMYDFDNAYVVDMQRLKQYIYEHYNELRAHAKKAYKKGAVNLMVHISRIPELRLKEFEDIFRKHAVLNQRDC